MFVRRAIYGCDEHDQRTPIHVYVQEERCDEEEVACSDPVGGLAGVGGVGQDQHHAHGDPRGGDSWRRPACAPRPPRDRGPRALPQLHARHQGWRRVGFRGGVAKSPGSTARSSLNNNQATWTGDDSSFSLNHGIVRWRVAKRSLTCFDKCSYPEPIGDTSTPLEHVCKCTTTSHVQRTKMDNTV